MELPEQVRSFPSSDLHDLHAPRCQIQFNGRGISTALTVKIGQCAHIFLHFQSSIAGDGGGDDLFHRHSNSVGEVVGFVDDDDDVLQWQPHCFEARTTNTFIEQVIVIADKHIGMIGSFSCCFPRASLRDFSVDPVYFGQINQFINMQWAVKDSFGQSWRFCDPWFACLLASCCAAHHRKEGG